jgi:predicted secreted Zn-dependent protease
MIRGIRVKAGLVRWLLAAWILQPIAAKAEWQPVEQVETYAVTGSSGAALYDSIGERGPELGGRRAVAHTTFKLTWTRKYERRGNACVLAVARPKLIITYTLPKPATKLSTATQASWATFFAGIETHERVHGDHIKEMVRDIEAMSVGLSADNDPDCRKIRVDLTKRLGELSTLQRQRGRDFDNVEMSEGGNIRRLVLQLVNGP